MNKIKKLLHVETTLKIQRSTNLDFAGKWANAINLSFRQ